MTFLVDKDILPSPSLSSQPLIEVSEEEEDPSRAVQAVADQMMDQTVPSITEEAGCQTNQVRASTSLLCGCNLVNALPLSRRTGARTRRRKTCRITRRSCKACRGPPASTTWPNGSKTTGLSSRQITPPIQVPKLSLVSSEAGVTDPKLISLPGISVGIQVNLSKSVSSPSLRRRLAERADLYNEETEMQVEVGAETQTETERQTKEPRRRGFSHDHTLGEEKQQCNAWKQVPYFGPLISVMAGVISRKLDCTCFKFG
jgi:hypothetical protein